MTERQVYWDEKELLHRLRRIEGQVRGIQALITQKSQCRTILTQVAAVEGALHQVSRIVEACSVAEVLVEKNGGSGFDAPEVRGALQNLLKPGR